MGLTASGAASRGAVDRAALVLGWALVLAPTAVSAQACEAGRVEVEGSCCWPGQRVVGGVCRGPPDCPAGHVATMDQRCLVVLASTPAPIPRDVPRDFVRDRDEGFLAVGASLFFSGYVTGIVSSFFGSGFLFPMAFFPVVGSLLGMIPPIEGPRIWDLDLGWSLALGGALTVAQGVGVVLIVVGEWGREVPRTVSLVPAATGADAGASLRVSF